MKIHSVILNLDDGTRVEIDDSFVKFSDRVNPGIQIYTAALIRKIAEIWGLIGI